MPPIGVPTPGVPIPGVPVPVPVPVPWPGGEPCQKVKNKGNYCGSFLKIQILIPLANSTELGNLF